ncbi:DUF2637 domain-containing protein [Streptomyces sp. OUCMDZ-4982]|uniref:DUF2637 domain-containing protein n=1 Tax=Streptomyces sp. OUCMDZ-4982 TaxID=2973090 RepID=UPI00215C6EEE|nr:DUF2637 domain-containing protein [Streptomyces sp. OUCMDZ-4982]MCR8945075.1 DUF2637 domain-containing protein [Streptomyces sp. OUCMDZ-4982]
MTAGDRKRTSTELTGTHRLLIGVVAAGAVIIAAIGFAGSYAAVRELAEAKGFGQFSLVFPIGIDAGICVLLALDLLLTWMRIPFPLLRQTAWLLTAATIAFNGAASWPDPLGTAMHAVIPVLFVVSVEAARHAVGRIADITADKHMEGVRLTRWLLSPVPTFKLWRRMKLWELRSYEQVIKLEQERLIYQARLQARFGRNWRRKAPVESMMPLRLAKYGVPLAETAPAGLAAAGIEPALLPPAPKAELPERPELSYDPQQEQEQQGQIQGQGQGQNQAQPQAQDQQTQQTQQTQQPMSLQKQAPQQQHHPVEQPAPQAPGSPQVPVAPETPQVPPTHDSPWFAAQKLPEGPHSSAYDPVTAVAGEGGSVALVKARPLADFHSVNAGFGRPAGAAGQTSTTGTGPLEERDLERGEMDRPRGTEAAAGDGSAAARMKAHEGAELERKAAELEAWNVKSGDTARGDESPAFNDPVGADGPGGAAADRTGQGRRVVHARIPDHDEDPAPPQHLSGGGSEQPDKGKAPEDDTEREEKPLTGLEIVASLYAKLSPDLRDRSANSLAPLLAEGSGYRVETVRKYLGDIRKAEKKAAAKG